MMIADIMTGGEPSKPVFDTDDDGDIDDEDRISGQNPAGETFLKGLPSSPTFFGNKIYVTGTNGGSSGTAEGGGTEEGGTEEESAGEGEEVDGGTVVGVATDLGGRSYEDYEARPSDILPTGRLSWQELKP
ncbi:hypothetical protein [Aliamphritea spongicola]|nr:hypothetical protein [Aliamphritea spongicola]